MAIHQARERISFRAEQPEDEAVVRRAHVAHRAALLAPVGWPADALARICDQQHELQERHIAAHNPHADRRMIVAGDTAIGRLCVERTRTPWRIVDIALLPEVQGRGLGSAALRAFLREAASAGVAVDLMVGHDNPRAEALYRRLGFVDALDASQTHRRLVRGATGGVGPDRRSPRRRGTAMFTRSSDVGPS